MPRKVSLYSQLLHDLLLTLRRLDRRLCFVKCVQQTEVPILMRGFQHLEIAFGVVFLKRRILRVAISLELLEYKSVIGVSGRLHSLPVRVKAAN